MHSNKQNLQICKVFNDGLNKKDKTKKVGILQSLKNIEDNLNSNDDGDVIMVMEK